MNDSELIEIDAIARRFQRVHGVSDHRLERRQIGRQLTGAQERDLRAVRARHLGHVRVVRGDDDAVDVATAAGRVERVGQERAISQPLDVQVGHGVRPAARGYFVKN